MWLFVLPPAVIPLDQFSTYIELENMALCKSTTNIEE